MADKKKWTFHHHSDEEKCELIDRYYDRKVKEVEETQAILKDIRETTTSNGDEEKTPAVQVTKTSKQYLKDSIPSIIDFAVDAGVSSPTIYKWYNDGKDENANDLQKYFTNKLSALKDLSQKTIIDARNKEFIDPVFAKFLLSAWYGYSEKTETDHTTAGEKITSINYIAPDGGDKS